jgi:spore maturation protein SpmB
MSEYGTGGFDTRSGDATMLQSIVSMFSGPLAGILTDIISNAIGRSKIEFPGGAMDLGPNALSGRPDAAQGMMNMYAQRTMNELFSATQQQESADLAAFRQNAYMNVFGMSQADAQQAAASNPIGSLVLNNLHMRDTAAMTPGMNVAAQHMGVSIFRQPGALNAHEEAVSSVMNAIRTDFRENRTHYGGLSGSGMGQLVADLARTGEISAATSTDNVKEIMREAAQTNMQMQRTFGIQGASNVRDFSNQLIGANMTGALGGGANDMMMQMAAAQFTSGAAGNIFQQFGGALGALQNSINVPYSQLSNMGVMAHTANVLSPMARMPGGDSQFFVNETALRANTLRNSFSSANSERAKMVQGAIALIGDEDKVKAFRQELQGQTITSSTIRAAAEAAGADLSDVSLRDMIDAGASRAGQKAAITGAGVAEADLGTIERGLTFLEGDTAAILESAGVGPAQRAKFAAALKKNRGNIGQAMKEAGINDPALEGRMSKVKGSIARSIGFDNADQFGTVAEATSAEARAKQAQIQEAFVEVQKEFGGRAGQGGIGDLMRAFALSKKGLSVSDAFGALTGTAGLDKQVKSFLDSKAGKPLTGALEDIVTGEGSTDAETTGADLLSKVLTGKVSISDLKGETKGLVETLFDPKSKMTQKQVRENISKLGGAQRIQNAIDSNVLERLADEDTDITAENFKSFVTKKDGEEVFDEVNATFFKTRLMAVRKLTSDEKNKIDENTAIDQVFGDDTKAAEAFKRRLVQEQTSSDITSSGKTGLEGTPFEPILAVLNKIFNKMDKL